MDALPVALLVNAPLVKSAEKLALYPAPKLPSFVLWPLQPDTEYEESVAAFASSMMAVTEAAARRETSECLIKELDKAMTNPT